MIAVENDRVLKIIRNANIGKKQWDSSESNNWVRPATLNTYLNNDYYNSLSADAQSQIQSHAYGIGAVTYGNTDLAGQIASENGTVWTGNIGLMSVSDYLRANTNIEQCGNFSLNNINASICKTTNYLYNKNFPWTISPDADISTKALYVRSVGAINHNSARQFDFTVWPVLYLKSDITLTGEGTQSKQYTIG